MAEVGLLLLVHGEVTDPSIDLFDREAVFLSKVLPQILAIDERLKVVLEHITTRQAVQLVRDNEDGRLAATITAHHLMATRGAIFAGGISPHYYCLPVLKTEEDRAALVAAAISGDARFFAGSDSAPHDKASKECCRGKAGIYTGYNTMELYAQVFAENEALDRLERFVAEYGARFYGLPLNEERMRLVRKPHRIPESFDYTVESSGGEGGKLIPFKAGQVLDWQIAQD